MLCLHIPSTNITSSPREQQPDEMYARLQSLKLKKKESNLLLQELRPIYA